MSSAAPFRADLAAGPDGGRAVWLHASDGVRLRVGVWAGGAKGTVILLPGRTEYIEKYGHAAGELLARGYSTLAIDWRGQGMADRLLPDPMLGHVAEFTDYQHDLDAALACARAEGLPEPYMLLGHSMGGSIGLRALTRDLGFRAAVFSAPMWGILMNAWQRPLAQVVTHLATAFGQDTRLTPGTTRDSYIAISDFPGNVLTTDRQMWGHMRDQLAEEPQFALGGPTLRWLLKATDDCHALAQRPAPGLPTICALGTLERVVDPVAVHLRMAGWSQGQLDLYPGAEHEIMMEGPAIRARFYDRAASLFDAQR